MNNLVKALYPVVKTQRDDPRRDILISSAVVMLFFVVLLGWAAVTPLDAAAHAEGVIAVSGNRQSVQHAAGGVVTAIHVREGQSVATGQVLIELAAPDIRATERALTSDYLTLLAQRARLLAQSERRGVFNAPAEFASLPPEDRALADEALRLQRTQFAATYSALSAQESVLGQRSRQLGQQQTGYMRQITSLQEQQRLLTQEIEGLQEIEKKGFASVNRIRALQRELANLTGREAAMHSEIARAGEGKGETQMQSLSMRRTLLSDVATELRDTQSKLSEVLPRLIAAREQLERAQVRAPATGQVVGLTVYTIGGVVAPGQTLMEIVPKDRMLVIQAQVSPQDADDIYPGQQAQIRFSSVHDRTLPLLSGTIRTISADSFTDEKSGRSYFRSEITVPRGEIQKVRGVLGHGQLRPGLPVEVVLNVRKRTALQYMLEPLQTNLWRSLREQ